MEAVAATRSRNLTARHARLQRGLRGQHVCVCVLSVCLCLCVCVCVEVSVSLSVSLSLVCARQSACLPLSRARALSLSVRARAQGLALVLVQAAVKSKSALEFRKHLAACLESRYQFLIRVWLSFCLYLPGARCPRTASVLLFSCGYVSVCVRACVSCAAASWW
jgi:hypothetical protein